jgi:hypothetical protein
MPNHLPLKTIVTDKFEVFDWRNGLALLDAVHPISLSEILAVLEGFVLKRSDIERGGGNKSPIARALDEKLYAQGWVEKAFDTRILVDGVAYETPTHSIDCFKDRVALEVEWNNKDPFFDRDLNNFRLLYDLRVIDLGVIITRATSLEKLLRASGRNLTTYGKATTHTDKLIPKIKGGGAGGCPIIVFGITNGAYRDDL